MNNLVKIETINGMNVVSSRDIAEGLGKRHSDVLESLDKILENGDFRSLIIPSNYKVYGQNRNYKEYLLTKDGFVLYMFNIQGYQEFKLAYINKFNEMEKALQNQYYIPQNYSEALKLAYEQQEQIEALGIENKVKDQQISELKPKATYYDLVLQCTDLLSTSSIAKDFGKSAQWLNDKLHELKIQYKQSGQWLLYQCYADKGYTSSKTTTYVDNKGVARTSLHTYWTQKGRLFIYDLLKDNGILPTIERI